MLLLLPRFLGSCVACLLACFDVLYFRFTECPVRWFSCITRAAHKRKLETRFKEWSSFRGANERRLLRNLAYLIVFIVVAFTAFICLVFAVKFSTEQKDAWLIGTFTGIFAGQSRC